MAEIFWPFDPVIINYGFGYPPGYGGFHNGIDFPVPQGTPLRATVSGRIRNNDAGQADGAGVDISTPDGWMVRMWHVSQFLVPNGSQVAAGDVVALSGGQRGTWGAGNATGPHLHWGTMVNKNWVDPAGLNPQSFDNGDEMTPEQNAKLNAIYDALFKTTEVKSGGYKPIPAGVLGTLSHVYNDGVKVIDSGSVEAIDYDRIIQGVADEISKRMAK